MSSNQKRYTFESVRENCRKLRGKLIIAIKENEPVAKDEKDVLLNLIDYATYGIGTTNVTFFLDDKQIEIPDFQHFFRCLVEHDKNFVDYDFWFKTIGKSIEGRYDIKVIWEQVLFNLNHFIPKAIEASAKMSKEIVDTKREVKTIKTKKK